MTVGDIFGPSSWIEIPQEKIDPFAEATGDHQWIHVDPERAKEGPFGTTIAHGYLTLSLIPVASFEVVPREGRMGINYGLNSVRFPAPVPVGSRVRVTFEVVEVEEIEGGSQVTMTATVEREGGDKPVCVAESRLPQLRLERASRAPSSSGRARITSGHVLRRGPRQHRLGLDAAVTAPSSLWIQ